MLAFTRGMGNDTTENLISPPPPESESRRRAKSIKHSKRWAALVILVIAVVALYFFLSPEEAPSPRQKSQKAHQASQQAHALPVETAQVRTGDIHVYVNALGTVTSLQTVAVISRVQGQILSVRFQEGQIVKKGDPLVEIDPKPFEAALLQAQGQLERDLALLRQSEQNLKRYQRAYAAKAISQQQVQDQIHLVQQNRGIVKSDQGLIETAQVNLGYCHITSPLDGRVGLRLIDPGNFVPANGANPLVVITQTNPIAVVFSVPEQGLRQIQEQLKNKEEMPVEAWDRTQKNILATGKFLALDNQIDTNTGTVKIKAIFDNSDNELFPNQFVNARILVETRHDATLIPSMAMQMGTQGAFVYVVQANHTVHAQNIKTEITEGDQISIQGLQAGQQIVTNGFDKLRDGVPVAIRNNPESAARSGSSQER